MASLRVHRDTGRPAAGAFDRPLANWRDCLVRLGLADVLIRYGWPVLVGAYGLDLIGADLYRGYGHLAPNHAGVGATFLVTAAVMWHRPKAGAGLAALVGFVAAVGPVASTTPVFVMWVSVVLWLFDRPALALRVLAVALYGFAAINKLIGPFITGDVIAYYAPSVPFPMVAAIGAVATESWLACMIWRQWQYAPLAVIAFHMPVALLVAATPHHATHLILYGLMVSWAVFFGHSCRAT